MTCMTTFGVQAPHQAQTNHLTGNEETPDQLYYIWLPL